MESSFPEVLVGQKVLEYRFALSEYHSIGPKFIKQTVEVLVVHLTEGTLTIDNQYEIETAAQGEDKLHALVNRRILSASLIAGEALTILFQDNGTLRIRLDTDSSRSPEALCYHPTNGNIVVLN